MCTCYSIKQSYHVHPIHISHQTTHLINSLSPAHNQSHYTNYPKISRHQAVSVRIQRASTDFQTRLSTKNGMPYYKHRQKYARARALFEPMQIVCHTSVTKFRTKTGLRVNRGVLASDNHRVRSVISRVVIGAIRVVWMAEFCGWQSCVSILIVCWRPADCIICALRC